MSQAVWSLAGRLGRGLFALASVLSALSVLSVFSVLSPQAARAQTDPRLIDAVRDAQEGRSDSARIKVRRLLAATSPNDTLYPQILYTQAMVASEANEMQRQLQRVAVEYSSSSWADDALLRLVQLDYASGNLDGSARNLERIRMDYPGSPLLPQAAYWAARTYFDQKSPELACRWIAEGLAGSRGNVELQNQLGYLDQRCASIRASVAARTRADSPAVETAAGDTAPVPPEDPAADGATPPPAATPPPDTVAATPAPAPAAAPAAAPQAARFRIQVSAVRTAAAAEKVAGPLRTRGLTVVTVEEGGLYKVRVGSYATRPEAVSDLPTIKAQLGGSPFVVAEP
ncbi:MAG: SPOR domain-containing protein [Gemmatimonadales bacterium]